MKYFAAIGFALLVAACGSPAPKQTPEQKAASARIAAIWDQRQAVSYKGNDYDFAHNVESSVAYIMPQNPKIEYTPADLEAIARVQTGCTGTFQAGVLEFIGGFNKNSNLGIITGNMPHWSVALKC